MSEAKAEAEQATTTQFDIFMRRVNDACSEAAEIRDIYHDLLFGIVRNRLGLNC